MVKQPRGGQVTKKESTIEERLFALEKLLLPKEEPDDEAISKKLIEYIKDYDGILLQSILRNLLNQDIAEALLYFDNTVVEIVLANMSQTRKQYVQEEMIDLSASYSIQTGSDARRGIIKEINRLFYMGEVGTHPITYTGGNTDWDAIRKRQKEEMEIKTQAAKDWIAGLKNRSPKKDKPE